MRHLTIFGRKVIKDKEAGFKTYFARCLCGKHWVDSSSSDSSFVKSVSIPLPSDSLVSMNGFVSPSPKVPFWSSSRSCLGVESSLMDFLLIFRFGSFGLSLSSSPPVLISLKFTTSKILSW